MTPPRKPSPRWRDAETRGEARGLFFNVARARDDAARFLAGAATAKRAGTRDARATKKKACA
jgi:hypothetical protein